MLDPVSIWVDEFKKLPPASTPIQGIINLADVIEKLTNKVDPNMPTADAVLPGIFKWNKPVFVTQMLLLVPTQTPDWIPKVASAWAAACMSGIVTPGKVTASSIWQVSVTDSTTIPAAAATIPTIAVGQAAIISMMSTVPAIMAVDPKSAQEMFAKSFRAAVAAFTFVLIGISGTPISPVPLPITFPAR
jgi:hypothetical protein